MSQLLDDTETALSASASRVAARVGNKGQQTKAAIVDAALGLATQAGLEGLSIGAVAELMRMSLSLITHLTLPTTPYV